MAVLASNDSDLDQGDGFRQGSSKAYKQLSIMGYLASLSMGYEVRHKGDPYVRFESSNLVSVASLTRGTREKEGKAPGKALSSNSSLVSQA